MNLKEIVTDLDEMKTALDAPASGVPQTVGEIYIVHQSSSIQC